MLTLLEGKLCNPNPEESTEDIDGLRKEPTTLEQNTFSASAMTKLYTFCLSWSIGAFIETEDRIKLQAFLKDTENLDLALPSKLSSENPTVFDFMVENDKWVPWSAKIPDYALPENYTNDYSTIMVPTVDSVRTNFLIDIVARQVKTSEISF